MNIREMYTANKTSLLHDLQNVYSTTSDSPKYSFVDTIKSKWIEIHNEHNVFRYKIVDLLERNAGKYLLMLNTERGSNRRAPEHIISIYQAFDDRRFNFTKVSAKEIMYCIDFEGDEHILVVNVSPIYRYHTLLCPSVKKKLPQVATADSLVLALEIMFLAQSSELKIVFNSLCGLASVNHLHYHLMFHPHTWPVQLAKWEHIKGPLHCIQDYPVDAFCFKVQKESLRSQVSQIYILIQYLLDHSIAHNIVIVMGGEGAEVFVFPRKSALGTKEFGDFNVAALELSGWITVYSTEAYHHLQQEDLEMELIKWKLENFGELCEKVKSLY